jgi:hypothetical protein
MEKQDQSELSFGTRVATAVACFFRVLANPGFARQAAGLLRPAAPAVKSTEVKPAAAELPAERLHASGLAVLSLLQREGFSPGRGGGVFGRGSRSSGTGGAWGMQKGFKGIFYC